MFKKMKTIYSIGLLLTCLLAITSCSDQLDLQPETTWAVDEFYGNETDINAALAGIHSSLSSYNTFGMQFQRMSSGTDESYKLKSWNEVTPTSIMIHNPSTEEIRMLYQNLYSGINNCNNFIKYINPDKFEEVADYNNFLGEAKFLRGLMYYYLTIWFNEVPLRLEPTKDQSSNHMAPSSVEDVYQQIIDDVTFATANLRSPFDGDFVAGHANSSAAHALLAKVYLKAAGYPLQATEINGINPYQGAKNHCDSVTTAGHVLNGNYKDVFVNYIQNRFDLNETLFEVCYRNGTDLGINIGGRTGSFNGLFINIKISKVGQPVASPEITPSPIHEYIYEEKDSLRQHWNVPGYGGGKGAWMGNGQVNPISPLGWGYTIGKFRRWDAAYPWDLEKTNAQLNPIITLETPEPINEHITGINFPLLRYSDVLLMYAEATNELSGPTADAIAAIDAVRGRAGCDPLAVAKPEALASPDAFFDEIVDERFRELCFESHRKHDLIRWNLLEDKLEELYESIIYEPGYTPAEAYKFRCYDNFDASKHLSLPYPEQEVLINNLLEQKVEWQ